ncbi:hypothetical protein [Nocardia terpenica]|uniref:Uncharacterized protein n=1 Tax=Nocardia terpenica TaxID=455432 RepID=A0A6G9YZ42_9NOCA|nr:hypothetical protein [Nocardia terpenica]QIS18472.1 hypothetical protein F6W96_09415 [Nocardia terpenica]
MHELADELRRRKQVADNGDHTARRNVSMRAASSPHANALLLLDAGSFQDIEPFQHHTVSGLGLGTRRLVGDGVATGRAAWTAASFSFSRRTSGCSPGTVGTAHAGKIHKIIDMK